MGTYVSQLVRHLHRDVGLHDRYVLRLQAAPAVSQQAVGQGRGRKGGQRERISLPRIARLYHSFNRLQLYLGSVNDAGAEKSQVSSSATGVTLWRRASRALEQRSSVAGWELWAAESSTRE